MKARRWDTTLYELAENQSGYFTAAQALVIRVLRALGSSWIEFSQAPN